MIFSKIHKFKKVSSTNELAFELARKGAKEGQYVVAAEQTKGRGRLQRLWQSSPGNIYISLILRPAIPASHATQMTFVSALAVAKTLEKYLDMTLQLKWPNDVLVKGKKIAGILTEIESQNERVEFMVVGIGININQEKFPKELPLAISLYQVIKKITPLGNVLKDLLVFFEEWYSLFLEKGFPFIKEMWEEKSLIKGKEVEIRDGRKKTRGIAMGLDEKGALLIQISQGKIVPVYTGDLHIF